MVKAHRTVLSRGLVIVCTADALGTGMFLPYPALYFLQCVPRVSVEDVGFALAVGGVAGLFFGLFAGAVTDLLGARWSLAGSGFVVAFGLVLHLATSTVGGVVVATFVLFIGQRLYWSSWPHFVADVSERSQPFSQAYARYEAVKAGAMAGGGLVGAFLVWKIGPAVGLSALLKINIAMALFGGFGTILVRLRFEESDGGVTDQVGSRFFNPGESLIQSVVRHPFRTILFANISFAPVWTFVTLLFPLIFVIHWGLPLWVGAAIFLFYNGVVFLTQARVAAWVARVPMSSVGIVSSFGVLTSVSVVTAGDLFPRLRWVCAFFAVVGVAFAASVYVPRVTAFVREISGSGVSGAAMGVFQTSTAAVMSVAPTLTADALALGVPAAATCGAACAVVGAFGVSRAARFD